MASDAGGGGIGFREVGRSLKSTDSALPGSRSVVIVADAQRILAVNGESVTLAAEVGDEKSCRP
jgi:hypothetical protein